MWKYMIKFCFSKILMFPFFQRIDTVIFDYLIFVTKFESKNVTPGIIIQKQSGVKDGWVVVL